MNAHVYNSFLSDALTTRLKQIVVMECRTEAAQCAYVVDCILMNAVANTPQKPTYGNTAVLYRRQVLFLSLFYP